MTAITVPKDKIEALCKRYHIARLAFFGSVLRDDFCPENDIDVLVEFLPGHTPGLLFFQMQDELSEILSRRVDLNTLGFIGRRFRDTVRKTAVTQYVHS